MAASRDFFPWIMKWLRLDLMLVLRHQCSLEEPRYRKLMRNKIHFLAILFRKVSRHFWMFLGTKSFTLAIIFRPILWSADSGVTGEPVSLFRRWESLIRIRPMRMMTSVASRRSWSTQLVRRVREQASLGEIYFDQFSDLMWSNLIHRCGKSLTQFCVSMSQYADLYTGSVNNLIEYEMEHKFEGENNILQHE